MSSETHAMDNHSHDTVPSHSTLSGYMKGFIASVILTAIPFWLVMSGVLGDKQLTAIVIMAFAAVQIVVHMIYFLHMDSKSEGGWNLVSLIFTLIILAIALTGSLWVMYHLNKNMMPQMNGQMSPEVQQLLQERHGSDIEMNMDHSGHGE